MTRILRRTLLALMATPSLAIAGGGGGGTPPPPPTINEAAWVTVATNWNNRCGGNSFVTCASVQVRRQNIGGYTAIELTVTNNSAALGAYPGTVLTAIGIATLPEPKQYAGWLTIRRDGAAPTTTGWAGGDDVVQGLSTILLDDPGGVTTRRGINDGIASGHTFVFRFYVDLLGTNYTEWQLAIHGQGGPNGCSTKMIVNRDGTTNQPTASSSSGCGWTAPPPSPVPEPSTIVLMATGMLFVGAGAWRRRPAKQV